MELEGGARRAALSAAVALLLLGGLALCLSTSSQSVVLLATGGDGAPSRATPQEGYGTAGGAEEELLRDIRGRRYNTSSRRMPGILNVHIVPHTHDDVGWLKTVDQYFYGARNDIQNAGVQYILDTVVQALVDDPERRFIYVEQAFFQRWWRQQSLHTQGLVRRLVADGRLEFVNGGWCMHDEAATHYADMIDQTTLGHRHIFRQFGQVPRVGWQIDPFGHSSTQASLLSAAVGFDALFFARIDYADMEKRHKEKTMEMVWRPSQDVARAPTPAADGRANGEHRLPQWQGARGRRPRAGAVGEDGIFTGVLYWQYGPPPGFNWNEFGADPPIMDDPALEDYNVEERVELFVALAREHAGNYEGDDIMMTMGSDFHYQNADIWFRNLDRLIHHVNADGRVNAFYSTPSEYARAKHAAGLEWTVKTDDFFPYADCPHCYWTGYFSSRPALKGYVRTSSALLHAARQLEWALRPEPEPVPRAARATGAAPPTVWEPFGAVSTGALEEALAVAQHHDGVSGTSKQHVADDYALRISRGAANAERLMARAVTSLLDRRARRARRAAESAAESAAGPDLAGSDTEARKRRTLALGEEQLRRCPLLNVSVCDESEQLRENQTLVVVAFNPLAWRRDELLRIPVTWPHLMVALANGSVLPSQVIAPSAASRRLRALARGGASRQGEAEEELYELVVSVSLPPLALLPLYVTPDAETATSSHRAGSAASGPRLLREKLVDVAGPGRTLVDAGHSRVELAEDGRVVVRFAREGAGSTAEALALSHSFRWYAESDGKEKQNPGQAGGAYIFRAKDNADVPVTPPGGQPDVTVVDGELVQEVRQRYAPWAEATLRMVKGRRGVELEWTVGPVPVKDGLGKEVVSRVEAAGVGNGGVFLTDSNGRGMVRRKINHRPTWRLDVTEPVAGNYYPINSAISIADDEAQLTLLTDRSQAATSLLNGTIDVIVHRRLLFDDWRGVAEPLNEQECTGENDRGQGGDEGNGSNGKSCHGLVVRGLHRLWLGEAGAAAAEWSRTNQVLLQHPVQLLFALVDEEAARSVEGTVSGPRAPVQRSLLRRSGCGGDGDDDEDDDDDDGSAIGLTAGLQLPPNVHLLTLQAWDDGSTLLRLAHLFQAGEHPELSEPATVDLEELFACSERGAITSVAEMSLTANQHIHEMRRLRWKTRGTPYSVGDDSAGDAADSGIGADEGGGIRWHVLGQRAKDNGSLLVDLEPMEIRTFLVRFADDED